MNLEVRESEVWGFRSFVIISFNNIVSIFRDWFLHSGTRQRGYSRLAPLCNYGAYHSQLSQSLPCIVNYGTRLSVNHLMYFKLPKSVSVLLKINFQAIYAVWGLFYSYYWYCLSYWNQIGSLHWKWTVVFVAVLSVTVINEHGDLTVHGICKVLQWLKHIHISRSKTKIKTCPAIKII